MRKKRPICAWSDGAYLFFVLSLMLVGIAGIAGCALPTPSEAAAAELRSPTAFFEDFLLRQELTFQRGGNEHSLQTAMQRRGHKLTLIGLTPLGTRAFVLQQDGLETSFTSHMPEGNLPFPPRLILHDIQRTLLPYGSWDPAVDGERSVRSGDMVVLERWREGRLWERRIRRRWGRRTGDIVIVYLDGYVFGAAPGDIELHNGWYGYHLRLRTLAYQRLE